MHARKRAVLMRYVGAVSQCELNSAPHLAEVGHRVEITPINEAIVAAKRSPLVRRPL